MLLFAGVFVIAEYGTTEKNFTCKGTQTINKIEESAEFGLRVDLYRWFIFWANSDGQAWVELPDGAAYFFPFVDNAEVYWAFADSNDKRFTPPFGQFSKITNKIMVGFGPANVIEGQCRLSSEFQ